MARRLRATFTGAALLLMLCLFLSPPGGSGEGGGGGVRLARAEEELEEEEEDQDRDTGEESEEGGDGEDEQEAAEGSEPLTAKQLKALHGKIDKDGSGRASLAEVMGFADKMMKHASKEDIEMLLGDVDTNKDGKLSLEEYMQEIQQAEEGEEEDDEDLKKVHEDRQKVEASKFAAADTDGDNLLDANEFPGLFFPETNEKVLNVEVEETLKQRDSNNDGELTQAEFFGVPDKEVEDNDKEMFEKLDKNKDGMLDTSEIKSWESGEFQTRESIQELFKVADKDNDGHVTADELIQAREKIADLEAQEHLSAWASANEL